MYDLTPSSDTTYLTMSNLANWSLYCFTFFSNLLTRLFVSTIIVSKSVSSDWIPSRSILSSVCHSFSWLIRAKIFFLFCNCNLASDIFLLLICMLVCILVLISFAASKALCVSFIQLTISSILVLRDNFSFSIFSLSWSSIARKHTGHCSSLVPIFWYVSFV